MDDVRGPPSGNVKTHWYRAHSSGVSTAEPRTIVPAPAGWCRMCRTNRSTASIPSLRPSGPQKTTSEETRGRPREPAGHPVTGP
jgi:hypothetical protein